MRSNSSFCIINVIIKDATKLEHYNKFLRKK